MTFTVIGIRLMGSTADRIPLYLVTLKPLNGELMIEVYMESRIATINIGDEYKLERKK